MPWNRDPEAGTAVNGKEGNGDDWQSVPGTEMELMKSTEKKETETTESTEKAEGTERQRIKEKRRRESTESTEKKEEKLMEETLEATEQKDKKEAEISHCRMTLRYLKYFRAAEGLSGRDRRSRSRSFYSAVYPRLGEGYVHYPKFSNYTVRHGIDVSYYQKNIDWTVGKGKRCGVCICTRWLPWLCNQAIWRLTLMQSRIFRERSTRA